MNPTPDRYSPPTGPRAGGGVHVLVDFPNVWHGVRAVAAERGEDSLSVRLDAAHLLLLCAAGRRVLSAAMTAPMNLPESIKLVFGRFFKLLPVDVGQHTGTELAGDEILQNHFLLQTGLQRHQPGTTLVLVTGDGAGWSDRRGFCALVAVAREIGLGIELLSFRRSLNPQLKTLAERFGAVDVLDDHFDELTFVTGGRRVTPLSPRLRDRSDATMSGVRERHAAMPPPIDHGALAAIPAKDRRLAWEVLRQVSRFQQAGLPFEAACEQAVNTPLLTHRQVARALLAMRRYVDGSVCRVS